MPVQLGAIRQLSVAPANGTGGADGGAVVAAVDGRTHAMHWLRLLFAAERTRCAPTLGCAERS